MHYRNLVFWKNLNGVIKLDGSYPLLKSLRKKGGGGVEHYVDKTSNFMLKKLIMKKLQIHTVGLQIKANEILMVHQRCYQIIFVKIGQIRCTYN